MPEYTAKDIRVAPIARQDADRVVKAQHYSGKIVNNSQLHLGVFLNGRLEGVMQFGPSLDKRKIQGLVRDTGWNDFLELNRMAFSDRLPRNSESRALAIAFRIIRKAYPHIEWIISFADGAQCGDGTIYRAAGFDLTGIKKNTSLWKAPDGTVTADTPLRGVGGLHAEFRRNQQMVFSRTSLTDGKSKQQQQQAREIISRTTVKKGAHAQKTGGGASMRAYKEAGFEPIPGFQLRYIYFLNAAARARLSVPVLPFSKIEEMGAAMYRGERISRVKKQDAGHPPALGGAVPTDALHTPHEGAR